MAFLHANEFAAKSGLPLRMVKRLCKDGKLPHLMCGRNYLVDEDVGGAALKDLQMAQCDVTPPEPIKPVLVKKGSFLAEIKALRKEG